MLPLISVIIPVYNAEQYLDDCVKSVLEQSYTNVSVILVDDGSTDGSGDICNSFSSNSKVKVIHTENRGVSCARNTGIDNSSGEYIAFLDADDELMPDALKTMYKIACEEHSDIVICNKQSYQKDGSSFKVDYPKKKEYWSGYNGLRASLLDHPATYSVWGKLFSRAAINNIRFAEGRKIHEDSFFVFECMLSEPKVSVADIPVIKYNVSDNSASRSKFSDKDLDMLYFAKKKCEILNQTLSPYKNLGDNIMLKAHMAVLKKLTLISDPKYKALEKASLSYIRQHKNDFISASESDSRFFKYIIFRLYYPRKLILKILKKR